MYSIRNESEDGETASNTVAQTPGEVVDAVLSGLEYEHIVTIKKLSEPVQPVQSKSDD